MRSIGPIVMSVGVALGAAAIALAAPAAAEPQSNLPDCTTAGLGGGYTGTQTTTCQSPGNVELNAAAPAPVYPYPWDDEFYGAPLIIAPGGFSPHGGGGGGHGGR